MSKIKTQISSLMVILFLGFTIWSLANATTPEESKAKGEAFLAENAKQPNIVTTASGLQYEALIFEVELIKIH